MEVETKEQWRSLLQDVDTILFDCDGVLWTGDSSKTPGAQEVIEFLRDEGKRLFFVTNNSSRSRQQYLEKFTKLGFKVSKEEIFSTSSVAAHYLKNTLDVKGKVYLIGQSGFADELELAGVPCIGPGPDPIQGWVSDWLKMTLDPEVCAVVVGMDAHFSYVKLMKALSYLNNPDCHFVATNEDANLPAESNIVIPGTGCLVKSLRYGSGRVPTIVGKPCDPMFNVIKDCTKLDPERTLMVGDKMDTDIAFGNTHGLKTLLVLTGISKRKDLNGDVPEEQCPDYFTESVGNMLKCWS